jgi:hypothetical protein
MKIKDIRINNNRNLNVTLQTTETDKEEIINSEIHSITAKYSIFSIENDKYFRNAKFLQKIKLDKSKFLKESISLKIRLNNLREPDKLKLYLYNFKLFLNNGRVFEVPILKSYEISDLIKKKPYYSDLSRRIVKDRVDYTNISKISQLNQRLQHNKTCQEKDIITFEAILPEKSINLYQYKPYQKLLKLKDLLSGSDTQSLIELLEDMGIQNISLDTKSLTFDLIFIILKLLYELSALDSLQDSNLLGKFFKKYFPQYLLPGVKS